MGDEMEFKEIMADSLDENSYIIYFAIADFILLILSFIVAVIVKKDFSEGKESRRFYYLLDILYTLAITLISLFPLLGMFGTVKALLELDMSQEMSVLQTRFFSALTSTAWGIIFSVIFKIINSLFQPYIENQINKAKAALKI